MQTFGPHQVSRIDGTPRFVQSPLLDSQGATNYNYLAVSHLNDFCSIRANVPHPRQSAILSKHSGDKNSPGVLRHTSSLSTPAFADDTFRAFVPGIESSLSLRFPPGLWSENVGISLFSPGSTTQSDFLDLSKSFSSLATRSTSDLVAAGLLNSSPSSGSYVSALDLQLDAQTGDYSLSTLTFLGTLGRGGYGKVLLAQSSRPDGYHSQVAVKVLAKRRMTEDDVREVKTEVQLLRALSKSEAAGTAFLQKLYTAFQTKEHLFIVMVRHATNVCGSVDLIICASFRNDIAQPCRTPLSRHSSVYIPPVV